MRLFTTMTLLTRHALCREHMRGQLGAGVGTDAPGPRLQVNDLFSPVIQLRPATLASAGQVGTYSTICK